MLTRLKALSLTRLCAGTALAVLALLLVFLGIIYAVRALFFMLQLHMTADIAAAVTAAFCLLLAIIAILIARTLLLPSQHHSVRSSAAAPAAKTGADIGTQIGLLLAQEIELKVQQNPKNTIILSALAGLVLGAAPKETAAALKSIATSLTKP